MSNKLKMSRKRFLNIYNSDRSRNTNLTTTEEVSKSIKVTRLNEGEIEKEMDELAKASDIIAVRDEKKYLIYKQKYGNDTVNHKVIKHGGFIQYYSDGRVPLPIINDLAQVPQSEIIYACKKEHPKEDVDNVYLASMATSVVVDVPVVLPDINIYDYLFSLHPLRYHVDKVRLSFPPLQETELSSRHKKYYYLHNGKYYMKAKYKYQCFCHLQEPLSTWKMNLWIVCDDQLDREKVHNLIEKDNKKFKYSNNISLMEGIDDVSK